jgi:hypothetical protein
MKPDGEYKKAINLNYDTASINFGVGTHSFFIHDGYYVFGGQSWGYKTYFQNVTYNLVSPTLDSHLFKFKPDGKANCFYQNDLAASKISGLFTRYDKNDVFYKNVSNYMKNIFNLNAYTSKYSGGFSLSDTVKYPKMCMD